MPRAVRYLATVLLTLLLPVGAARAQQPSGRTLTEPEQAFAEMRQTFGFVPGFAMAFPRDAIAGAWGEVKTLLLQKTAIPQRYKALIGVAVAAQIPGTYSLYLQKRVAQSNGASDDEVHEALVMAALTRQWSTVLNGLQIDKNRFRTEVAQIDSFLRRSRQQVSGASTASDAPSAYADMRRTLGIVPTFFRLFPEQGIAGAWREFKAIELNPDTAVPAKYKELIGLAVASQVPCDYCTYFHTQAAKLDGATDAEIREAVAVAGVARHWSTFFEGLQPDHAMFQKEVDRMYPLPAQAPGAPMRPQPAR